MTYPFLISLPHCSSCVPDKIQSYFALDENEILESEDFLKNWQTIFSEFLYAGGVCGCLKLCISSEQFLDIPIQFH